jgi:hypothetical protein
MNAVFIIPTGIGCNIGGHAGDANPAVKLIGRCCDKLITHPNAVNASDINEMPDNALYVEGSILNRFLRGEIFLQEVFYNRILLVVNSPVVPDTINAMNAARVTIGADIILAELETPLMMTGFYIKGKADGEVHGWQELCQQVENYDFDALAIQSSIKVRKKTKIDYLHKGGVNPWGGIEAITSKLVADKIDKPVAHSPFVDWQKGSDDFEDFNEVVDPRMSAEMVSVCYLHCILKGLHKAPRIDYNSGLSVDDIDFLISPINCVGDPHLACIEAGIPVIAVRENTSVLNDKMPESFIVVENYLEAAGILMAYRAGVDPRSCRRPIEILSKL